MSENLKLNNDIKLALVFFFILYSFFRMKINNISKQFKKLMINYRNKLMQLKKNKKLLILMSSN